MLKDLRRFALPMLLSITGCAPGNLSNPQTPTENTCLAQQPSIEKFQEVFNAAINQITPDNKVYEYQEGDPNLVASNQYLQIQKYTFGATDQTIQSSEISTTYDESETTFNNQTRRELPIYQDGLTFKPTSRESIEIKNQPQGVTHRVEFIIFSSGAINDHDYQEIHIIRFSTVKISDQQRFEDYLEYRTPITGSGTPESSTIICFQAPRKEDEQSSPIEVSPNKMPQTATDAFARGEELIGLIRHKMKN